MLPSSPLPFLLLPLFALACGAAPVDRARAPTVEHPVLGEIVEQGRAAAERGDTVRAEQYFTLAIARGADQRTVLPLLVRACLSSSRLRAALNHAAPYLRVHPEEHALRYLVATVYVALGEEDSARLELEQLLRRDGGTPYVDAHYLLGVLDSASNAEGALGHFRAYLALAPAGHHTAEVRGRLSELLARTEQNARAASAPIGQRRSEARRVEGEGTR